MAPNARNPKKKTALALKPLGVSPKDAFAKLKSAVETHLLGPTETNRAWGKEVNSKIEQKSETQPEELHERVHLTHQPNENGLPCKFLCHRLVHKF